MRALLSIVIAALMVTGCDGTSRAPATPYAQVGTRAVIKSLGREFVADVTRVENKLVTVEFRFRPDDKSPPLVIYDYYRGLIPVSGIDNGKRFELEYPEDDLESLFPLKKGKKISFEGSMQFIDTGESLALQETIKVLGKKTIDLDSGPETVYVVEIDYRLMDGQDLRRKSKQYVYFAPALSMVLKTVRKEDGGEFFWRVVSIDRAEDISTGRPRRRGGTVAI